MSIVTKAGDKGRTSLSCGKKVAKDDLRIEACGALDEVCSFLGLAKAASKNKNTRNIVHSIQKELFILGAEVAMSAPGRTRAKKRIDKSSVCVLEREIKDLELRRSIKIRSFCVPGSNGASGALDVARAVTRRAERRCVTLARKGMIDNPSIVIYLNRLSDLLYLLARLNGKNR